VHDQKDPQGMLCAIRRSLRQDGTFLMSSPDSEEERSNNERLQHKVKLREYFLAQTPITQKQWRVVAGWEQVERDLPPDPSEFKGVNRPVEQVSWIDAMEFCARLSQRTGKSYGLPSEAQWEYACRAGTTTPFHFGATLTPELANYNANHTYGGGPKGVFRQETTPVGSFPANAFGLLDMHGNVWDWCLDHWHVSYEGAPGDGSAWLVPAAGPEKPRLLRGGSWYSNPVFCRSAFRYSLRPGNRHNYVGFRVCCLPPGLPS
jgi:formylglycine-generating enzyme required for sulfatase activity